MPKPFRVYMGYDPRDDMAYRVAELSLREHTSVPIEVIPIREWECRRAKVFWRPYRVDDQGHRFDDRDGKPFGTEFSFTRFVIPLIERETGGWVLFTDPDVVWRADIAELIALLDDSKALMCVQHDHRPPETEKGVGLQQHYHRKNWSSVLAFRISANKGLSKYWLNNQTGSWLHALLWVTDEEIGALHEEWNWLCGWSDPSIDPKLVHFTRGTPDMPGYEDEPFADEWRKVRDRVLKAPVGAFSLAG